MSSGVETALHKIGELAVAEAFIIDGQLITKADYLAMKAESGWDLQSNELAKVKAERDTAWAELKEIRESIQANPEESTADEVRRVIAQKTQLIKMVDLGLMRNPNYEPT